VLRSLLQALMLGLLLQGCSAVPPRVESSHYATHSRKLPAHPALRVAVDMLGAPYRYGGASPRGFDCSGLVYFAFRRTGVRIPRSTSTQLRHARPVARSRIQPGDLVFFRSGRHRVSHVGIYAGNGRFIHAPSKGKPVSFSSMNDPYWQEHFVAAGRY
jgi:cell wall-associated NlpC family hydrolase